MHKTMKNHAHSEFDLYNDVEKIKCALKDATSDVRGKAAEIFTESLESAEEKSAALKANVTDYIEEKPLQSLGIAMFVGLVLGLFIRK